MIREERTTDRDDVFSLNAAAFETDAEARLVDALREQAHPSISLVAERDGRVVGHILFTPVALSGHPDLRAMGLAPMAVAPDRQRGGIGSALIHAGLEACRKADVEALVVLGHPRYYPKFGFVPASRFGIDSEYDVPDEVFMAQELVAGALEGRSGTIRYHEAFRDVG